MTWQSKIQNNITFAGKIKKKERMAVIIFILGLIITIVGNALIAYAIATII